MSLTIDADSTWQEVFDDSPASVQVCIRDVLEDDLEWALAKNISSEIVNYSPDWEESIFKCLNPEIAQFVFLYATKAYIEEFVELDKEEFSCVQEWISNVSVATLAAADNDWDERGEFWVSLHSCAPDLIISGRISEWELTLEGVKEEEASCLRREAGAIDVTALFTSVDESAEKEFQASLSSCLPDLPLHLGLLEFGLSLADLTEEEVSCFREDELVEEEFQASLASCLPNLVIRTMLSALEIKLDDLTEEQRSCLSEVTDDFDAYFCVPDLIILPMLWASGIALDDLKERELACLREQVADIDVTAFFAVDPDGTDESEGFLAILAPCFPEAVGDNH